MDIDLSGLKNSLSSIYQDDPHVLQHHQERFADLLAEFNRHFGRKDVNLFSAPGRVEIGGNHTDHNHGRVLAASINLDSIAAAAKSQDNAITLYSAGYKDPFIVKLDDLSVHKSEIGTTHSLIRGIAARFAEDGYNIGGFNACINSDVLPGSGLSSSASIEVLIGFIISTLYNDSKIPPEKLALIGQYAENNYFGKPCGLMDQMACAMGGIITIDFKDPQNAEVRKVDFDFEKQDYNLLVVDTGGSHADLTDDYAAVPAEMKEIAGFFNVPVLRKITVEDFFKHIPALRQKCGDRAVLRAYHFLQENDRVADQVHALEAGDFNTFLSLVTESGNSSFRWLQNVYSAKNVNEQGVSLALALTEKYCQSINAGAFRVHGGGFAGTIQVFLPVSAVPEYVKSISHVFGDDAVKVLNIRDKGLFNFSNAHFKR